MRYKQATQSCNPARTVTPKIGGLDLQEIGEDGYTQTSTTTLGSKAIASLEILGVFGQRLYSRPTVVSLLCGGMKALALRIRQERDT